jgi:predicted enzyme related to lactoylglutathione lyase
MGAFSRLHHSPGLFDAGYGATARRRSVWNSPATAFSDQNSIHVGGDLPALPHLEPVIAARPSNPLHLVAAAIDILPHTFHSPLFQKASSKRRTIMQRSTTSRNRLVAAAAFLLVTSFLSGFTFKTMLTQRKDAPATNKVTGIGGIFFKCKDPEKLKEWYRTNLGLHVNQYGASFEWYEGPDSTKKGITQWSPFAEKTKYFEPSAKDFMINYRVDNLEGLVEELKKNGVTFVDTMESFDYGTFVHIMDAEGNKVELWEPKG